MLRLLSGWKTTLIAAGIAAAVGFGAGWKTQGWRWDAALADAREQAIEDFKAQQAEDTAISREGLKRGERREQRVRVIEKEVPRVVTEVVTRSDCRLPGDYVRVLNDAVRANSPDAAGVGDASVPDPAHP